MIGNFARTLGVLTGGLLVSATGGLAQDPCQGVSPVHNTALKSVAVVTGLSGPMFVASPPGDLDRLFIPERRGVIKIWKRGDPPGTTTTFLDITAVVNDSFNEMGLLGLAFDPDYGANGFFYVNYTDNSLSQVVARYTVSADPDVANPASELQVMRFPLLEANHNGGLLLFDGDGYLYVFTGDGGGVGDQHGVCGNGQLLSTLLGKILRIDVAGVDPSGTSPDTGCMTDFTASGYTVPSDNPFADGPGGDCDEVWALGFRNPWRASFDAATGDLYVGDVGQACWEEVNWAPAASAAGRNYGWRLMEGNHCYQNPPSGMNCDPATDDCSTVGYLNCNDPGLTDPILEFGNAASAACAVIGGYVYRGCLMPDFHGVYFYGDNCVGFVKSFVNAGGVATNLVDWSPQIDPGGTLAFGLSSFGVDPQNEIYITSATSAGNGRVLRILPPFPDLRVSGPGAGAPFLLSKSGGWTWEDLERSTMHPVDFYRVYRGTPGGTLSCIHSTLVPQWTGDAAVPAAGQVFGYVVTAVSGTEESASGDPPRILANPCPAP